MKNTLKISLLLLPALAGQAQSSKNFGDPYNYDEGFGRASYARVEKEVKTKKHKHIDSLAKASEVPLKKAQVIVSAIALDYQEKTDQRLKAKKGKK